MPFILSATLALLPGRAVADALPKVESTAYFQTYDDSLGYAEFRELLKRHYNSAVYVFYRPGTDEVVRIKLSADIKPSASPAIPPANPGQDDQRRRPGFRTGS